MIQNLMTGGRSVVLQGALLWGSVALLACSPQAITDVDPADAGLIDAGSADAGSADAGSADAGSTDAGSADAGVGHVEGWGYPTWQDEFDTSGTPDPTKWNVRDRSTLGLLNDATVVRATQAVVVDGVLELRGEWMEENEWLYTATGPQGNPTLRAMKTGYVEHRITSASDTVYAQRWGMWEYRVKVPMAPGVSLGTLAAVWLRNARTGEIDLTEGWGSGPATPAKTGWYPAQPKPSVGRTAFTIHSQTLGGGTKEAWTQPGPALYDAWAAYRFIYTPNEFSFHRKTDSDADWVEQLHLTPTSWRMIPGTYSGAPPATQDHFAKFWTETDAYDAPWHIRLNLHLGPSTSYWGVPDPDNQSWTDNPIMKVDYVRIYAYPPSP